MHYLLGYGSLIVGIATILTGLPEVEPEASPAVVGLYIAWTALLVLVFLILAVSLRYSRCILVSVHIVTQMLAGAFSYD